MDRKSERRMRWNLAKGTGLLVGGLVAIVALDRVAGAIGAGFDGDPTCDAGYFDAAEAPSYDDGMFFSAVFDGDYTDFGVQDGVPSDFVAECFSPVTVGEARYAEGGRVVSIVSGEEPEMLQRLCGEALQSHGWIRVESGDALRASFVKGSGRYRWLYLGTTPVADSSSAVIVLHEEAA